MPRRKRNMAEPCCYHITHRCQERRYLLKFGTDRRNYLRRMLQMKHRYPVDVLTYMATCNHIHLLLWAKRAADVSQALQFLQGSAAGDYNRRKGRQGAFWAGRYHPTLVETGSHLSRCLFYIDLNMGPGRSGRSPEGLVGERLPRTERQSQTEPHHRPAPLTELPWRCRPGCLRALVSRDGRAGGRPGLLRAGALVVKGCGRG